MKKQYYYCMNITQDMNTPKTEVVHTYPCNT